MGMKELGLDLRFVVSNQDSYSSHSTHIPNVLFYDLEAHYLPGCDIIHEALEPTISFCSCDLPNFVLRMFQILSHPV